MQVDQGIGWPQRVARSTAVVAAVTALSSCATEKPLDTSTIFPRAEATVVLTDGTVNHLMAAWAQRDSSMQSVDYHQPKHAWVSGFRNPGDALAWEITLPRATNFLVEVIVKTPGGPLNFQLSASNGERMTFRTTGKHWGRVRVGAIRLPAGKSWLRITGDANRLGTDLKSLELIRSSDLASYNARVRRFKAAAEKAKSRLSRRGYGVMFQYGPWSYPLSGPKKSIDDHARDFNLAAFVDLVKETGATYVIWSATWWEYAWYAPVKAVDETVAHSGRTSSRDLIGEIAKALERQNIDFYLYYHAGHDGHFGYNKTDWWRAQQWPDEFRLDATGDRSAFFRNWISVVSEVGERYGRSLDGWFFDDGGFVYYPADFERLSKVGRRGNASRLIAWNSWELPRITDFQDVNFGEDGGAQGRRCVGQVEEGSAPVGGSGVFQSGPYKGLLQHCMIRLENDWGVHELNTPIPAPEIDDDQAVKWYLDARKRGVPLTFNLMMFEGGIVSPQSLLVLKRVKRSARPAEELR